MEARERLVFPLDYPTLEQAIEGAERVAPAIGVFKVGLELFVEAGPRATDIGRRLDRPVFLDLKLHDIPETVKRATSRAAELGARFLTVHASGGIQMLKAAAQAVEGSETMLLAVTVLTSLDDRDLDEMAIQGSVTEHAVRLAQIAAEAGIRGFVSSPREARALRNALGGGALLVVPGVRPEGTASGDQKRVATPASAIADGADLLVVGRPIRDARDPLEAARAVVSEIERSLGA